MHASYLLSMDFLVNVDSNSKSSNTSQSSDTEESSYYVSFHSEVRISSKSENIKAVRKYYAQEYKTNRKTGKADDICYKSHPHP